MSNHHQPTTTRSNPYAPSDSARRGRTDAGRTSSLEAEWRWRKEAATLIGFSTLGTFAGSLAAGFVFQLLLQVAKAVWRAWKAGQG